MTDLLFAREHLRSLGIDPDVCWNAVPGNTPCQGPVVVRPMMHGNKVPIPRCDHHYAAALARLADLCNCGHRHDAHHGIDFGYSTRGVECAHCFCSSPRYANGDGTVL